MVVDAGAVVAAVVVTGGGCCVWKDEKEEDCIYGNEYALVGVRHCYVCVVLKEELEVLLSHYDH